MHKLITPLILMLGVSLLTACTNPLAKNEDFATVSSAHRTALLAKMATDSLTAPNGKIKFSGNMSATTSSGTMQASFASDSLVMGLDSDTTLTLSGSANTPELGGAVSMNLNMNALSKSGSGYVRINTLDLVTGDPAISGMIGGFIGSLKNKWLLLDGETAILDQTRNQNLVRELQKSFAEKNLLIMTREVGLKDGVYNYEISVDKKELFELAKTITTLSTGTGMTATELDQAQKSIDASAFSGTLSVNQSNKEYGSMTLNYMLVEPNSGVNTNSGSGSETLRGDLEKSSAPEAGTISYDFNSDGIKLGFKDTEQSMLLELKKSLTKYAGALTIKSNTDNKTQMFPIEISKDGETFVMSVQYAATDKLDEIQSMNAILRVNIDSKANGTITAPTNAKSISEVMGGLLGGMGGASAGDE